MKVLCCVAVAVLTGCGGSQFASGLSSAATAEGHSAHETVITLANPGGPTAYLVDVTPDGCPWRLENAPPQTLYRGSIGGRNPLTYDKRCTPVYPQPAWAIAYGSDLTDSQTVCAWNVSFSRGSFSYGVKNGAKTNCQVHYNAITHSEVLEYFPQ